MKTAKVTFSNGDVITTSINGTEQTIKEYYAIGKLFNLGSDEDNMQKVVSCEVSDFETGATTHAVNDLILYTDNTRELAELRDEIYLTYSKHSEQTQNEWQLKTRLIKLFSAAKLSYKKEFGHSNADYHIKNMNEQQIDEYCQLYAADFDNWKTEHGM